ncbi:MAG: response regulator, partial [Cyclobacteriaceae bacterium]
ENFQQATSGTSRLYGGTGLGLAIVKQLVEAQGGSIHVESKLNEGCSFSFRLNFQKTTSDAELETAIAEPDIEVKNIKILVVEDIALNQLLMRTILNDFGFECEITSNGKLAVELLGKKPFDIILMDLQMPQMNGFEATEYIRNKLKLDIPIIALTADVTTVDLEKCKSVGMNDYIAKPIDERLLFNKIINFLKKPSLTKMADQELIDPKKLGAKCTNLEYLTRRTKSDPRLMMEMISLFLGQTDSLIGTMKQAVLDKDWKLLRATAHKMIPSFSIVGIDPYFEGMAKQVQEYAGTGEQMEQIPEMVLQLIDVLGQACSELEGELENIKTTVE